MELNILLEIILQLVFQVKEVTIHHLKFIYKNNPKNLSQITNKEKLI